MTVTTEHLKMLAGHAITQEVVQGSGIESNAAGDVLRFPWSDGVSPVVWQSRPDRPREDDKGRPMKYVFPKGAKVPLNRLRDSDMHTRLIIAEGTCQQLAVQSHAPADFAVYGLAGCWGWKHADLTVVDGRDVFLLLDADLETNPDVYAAAEQFTKRLKLHGAKSVAYVATTGSGKDGVDDVLAAMPEERRASALRTWLANAPVKLPKRPKPKRPVTPDEDDAAKLFRIRDKPLSYQPYDGATEILERFPAALTREGNIALYANGVYSVDSAAVMGVVAMRLKNYYSPSYVKSTSDLLSAMLRESGSILPERMDRPLLNCVNGMVDLATGELLPHDPKHMSYVQVATAYEQDSPTPVYDAWLAECLRQPGAGDLTVAALVADLEETAGTMLDPSRTPSKALFLFGKSRSGKSTFLRLLKAIAGAVNTSAVTLHQLMDDTFASANLYGRMLNVAADLSNKHVEDLSTFKMLAGEDVINANRKYGQQFEFTNQALIAFSANELPTVSEASRAYAERMKPFEFPNSFAGREDKHIEGRLMAELPGILARWVKAYGAFLARGGYSATDAATQSQFEAKSDRVVQFFQDMCQLTDAQYGQTLTDEQCTGRRLTSEKFNEWASRQGASPMGERALFQRIAQIPGVTEVRNSKGSKAYNLVVAKSDDDSWSDASEPQPDPIAPSGVTAEYLAGNPWVDAEAPCADVPVPVPGESFNGHVVDVQAFREGDVDLSAPATDPFAIEGGIDYFG